MELEAIIKAQNDKISQLTDALGQFFNVANKPSNVVYLPHQSIKGGSKKGQKARTLNQLNEEELEFMRLQKNVRLRKDGRFEWQKMIAGVWHREIDFNYKKLKMKIADHERELKHILKHAAFRRRFCKDSPILFDLCKKYVN